jgi:N-acetyltransferase
VRSPGPTARPVVLEGTSVRLEPLEARHAADLAAVAEPAIFEWMLSRPLSFDEMQWWIAAAVERVASHGEVPFATIDRASGRAVGSTRFLAVEPEHRRLEIGWTWIAPPWQRTAINTEAKLLQLRHAFDELGCVRVEFKTDSLNRRSRGALLRLGAVEEGTLRNHMLMPDGRHRHSVYFSVLDSEWPAIRLRLERALERGTTTEAAG